MNAAMVQKADPFYVSDDERFITNGHWMIDRAAWPVALPDRRNVTGASLNCERVWSDSSSLDDCRRLDPVYVIACRDRSAKGYSIGVRWSGKGDRVPVDLAYGYSRAIVAAKVEVWALREGDPVRLVHDGKVVAILMPMTKGRQVAAVKCNAKTMAKAVREARAKAKGRQP